MKANVIHGDFNPCGGAERLSLMTMRALLGMGIDFDLTTLQIPDIPKLENSYGKNLVSVMKSINKINVINIMKELQRQQEEEQDHEDYNYDITINTNGDAAPYYLKKHWTLLSCQDPFLDNQYFWILYDILY